MVIQKQRFQTPNLQILFSRIYNRLFGNLPMYSFKSSPLIQECPNRPKRGSKRTSTLHMKQPEYKIANPFRTGQQQNFLPDQLKQQIQQMDFITPTSITKIEFPSSLQSQRRSSNFSRHLSMMQNAARQQEEKFKGFMSHKKQKKHQQTRNQMIQEDMPMSISEMDNLSIDMENCLNQMNYRDFDNEEFGIFDPVYENDPNEIIFYSQHEIPQTMQQEINNDFSCYFDS